MRAVVMPTCPYCSTMYSWLGETNKDPLKRCKPHTSVLVACPRCKERYYVSTQQRFIGRRKP